MKTIDIISAAAVLTAGLALAAIAQNEPPPTPAQQINFLQLENARTKACVDAYRDRDVNFMAYEAAQKEIARLKGELEAAKKAADKTPK